MTLDYIFENYSGKEMFSRAIWKIWPFPANIEYLKRLKLFSNQEARSLGFIIPQFMIDNAEADDWELVE